jgi:hypothetical protein
VSKVARCCGERLIAGLCLRAGLGAVVVLIGVLTFAGVASARPIVVDFSYSPAAPKVGAQVTFVSTSELQRPIVREDWDFDGDGQLDASGRSVTHRFTSAGTYTVTLQVQNDRGRVRRTSKLVTVYATPPAAPPPPPPAAPPRPPVAPPPPASTAPSSIPPPAAAPVPAPTTSSPTGVPAPPMTIVPFPVVRITGSYTKLGVRLRLLAVTAPVGVTITVRCAGRGCPYQRSRPFVLDASDSRPVGAARYVRIRGFRGRLLKPGVRLRVFVADQDQVGKYTSFTIRRGHPPIRADGCLRAGSASVFSCA